MKKEKYDIFDLMRDYKWIVLIYFIVINLFMWVVILRNAFADNPIPNWPTYYEGFESRTVDQQIDDGSNGPLDSTVGDGGQYADQTLYVRDDLTPRYGDKYLHIKATWSAPSSCGDPNGYGNYGFRRGFILLRGTELYCSSNGDNLCLDIDNGTEYWLAWSQYIPDGEKQQIGESGLFQIQSDQGLSFISYWGEQNADARVVRFYGSGSYSSADVFDWQSLYGTWVDWVIQIRLYTSNNANARTRVYINGVLDSDTSAWDGLANARTSTLRPYLVWQNYNWWACGNVTTDTNCAETKEGGNYNYWGCENNGTVEGSQTWEAGWTRNYIIDELRVNEYTSGQGDHYCAVAPPIWAAQPSISYPTNNQSNLSTSFTALFDGYSDHRTDAQSCFVANHMNVEVDESGGDWSTLVYDSGDISTASSQLISGLSTNTYYQMRVRHSSYNDLRAEEYWGGWSDTRYFSTEQSLNTFEGLLIE